MSPNFNKKTRALIALAACIFASSAVFAIYFQQQKSRNPAGSILGEDISDIVVNSEVISITKLERGYEVIFLNTIENRNDSNINNLSVDINLGESLRDSLYSIIKLESDDFIFNNNFDGSSTTSLLQPEQILNANSTSNIKLTLEIDPGTNKGPFDIYIETVGELEGEIVRNGNNESENDVETDTETNTVENQTQTEPEVEINQPENNQEETSVEPEVTQEPAPEPQPEQEPEPQPQPEPTPETESQPESNESEPENNSTPEPTPTTEVPTPTPEEDTNTDENTTPVENNNETESNNNGESESSIDPSVSGSGFISFSFPEDDVEEEMEVDEISKNVSTEEENVSQIIVKTKSNNVTEIKTVKIASGFTGRAANATITIGGDSTLEKTSSGISIYWIAISTFVSVTLLTKFIFKSYFRNKE